MGLNKQSGNMYDFVTHTWNPIKGECEYKCKYCYMKKWGKQLPPRLDENEMQTNLGKGNFIFVGSGIDMFAPGIYTAWIERVLEYCSQFSNTYLFQSKNPEMFFDYEFPCDTIFGTTIESNRDYPEISKAPKIQERVRAMIELYYRKERTMVTIEPVLDFDVSRLFNMINLMKPEWVNLGADSGGHKLPEPSKGKLLELISKIDVKQKKNLNRLLN